jgi:hypothetical protein
MALEEQNMADMTQHPVGCTLNEPDFAERRPGPFTDLAQRRQEARPRLETEQAPGA